MGIYVLSHPKNPVAAGLKNFHGDRSKSLLSRKTEEPGDTIAIDLPLYASECIRDDHDDLGCMRGIAFALAIQAAVALFAFILWRVF